jgi:hypothetical protein
LVKYTNARQPFFETLIINVSQNYSMPRGVKQGISRRKFDRAVSKIKRKGGARNPYAVANAKLGGKKSKSRKRK